MKKLIYSMILIVLIAGPVFGFECELTDNVPGKFQFVVGDGDGVPMYRIVNLKKWLCFRVAAESKDQIERFGQTAWCERMDGRYFNP